MPYVVFITRCHLTDDRGNDVSRTSLLLNFWSFVWWHTERTVFGWLVGRLLLMWNYEIGSAGVRCSPGSCTTRDKNLANETAVTGGQNLVLAYQQLQNEKWAEHLVQEKKRKLHHWQQLSTCLERLGLLQRTRYWKDPEEFTSAASLDGINPHPAKAKSVHVFSSRDCFRPLAIWK